MRPTRVHWLRTIRGTQDRWLHCGRALDRVAWTRQTSLVTCLVCRGYLLRGEAAGYTSSQRDTIHEPEE